MGARINYVIGQKIGAFTYLGDVEKRGDQRVFLLKCHCGKKFTAVRCNLNKNNLKSCGCLSKHTNKQSLTYWSWHSIKQRCLNPNHHNYPRYRGSGITMDERWIHSYKSFLEDMGERPSKLHTCERIDNLLGYFKDNCRWATMAEQSRNKCTNHNITYNGKTMCITDWAHELNIPSATLVGRINRRGMSIEAAFTTPINIKYSCRYRNSLKK